MAEIYRLTGSIEALKRFSILSKEDKSSLELDFNSLLKRLRQRDGML